MSSRSLSRKTSVQVKAEVEQAVAKRKVGICLDESEFSMNAFVWALDRGHITPADFWIFIHVQPVPKPPFGSNFLDGEVLAKAQHEQNLATEALEEEIQAKCKAIGAQYTFVVRQGDPKEHILTKINQLGIERLIIGEQGAGVAVKLKKALVGSVADYLKKNAPPQCEIIVHESMKRRGSVEGRRNSLDAAEQQAAADRASAAAANDSAQ